MMTTHLIRAAKFVVLAGIAVLVGLAATFASALVGHWILVLLYGDDLSVIDDTLPMIAAVWTSYLVGVGVGLGVLVVGWRRFVRERSGLRQPGG
jgi:hypothetical protein